MFNMKDKEIIDLLKRSSDPLSTYQIAKDLKMSWSTANLHCFKLKTFGKIECEFKDSKFGQGMKMVWWINRGEE